MKDQHDEDRFRMKLAGFDLDQMGVTTTDASAIETPSGGSAAWRRSLQMNAKNRRN